VRDVLILFSEPTTQQEGGEVTFTFCECLGSEHALSSRIQSRLQLCSVSVKEMSPTSAKMGKTSLVNRALGRAYTISNYSMKPRLATAQL